jgi:hypothetical protein
VSFVPLYGDAFALGYYGAQGGLDCAAGSGDPVMVGINLGGSIPIVGDLGKAVKYGGMGIGFLGLVTKGGRHADDLARLPRALRGGPADTFVYKGMRGSDEVYVGITKNLNRRASQHADRFDRLVPVTNSPVTRGQARAIEEALIAKNQQFENIYHSISPRYPWYAEAKRWGNAWLELYA